MIGADRDLVTDRTDLRSPLLPLEIRFQPNSIDCGCENVKLKRNEMIGLETAAELSQCVAKPGLPKLRRLLTRILGIVRYRTMG